MGICRSICGSAAEELAEAAPTMGSGEDYGRAGYLAKKGLDPLSMVEKTVLPFCTLLCSAFERELNKVRIQHDDYERPYVTIGALKKALAGKRFWDEAFASPDSSPFWAFIKHEFLRA
jgi:hypothetical protein